MGLGGEIGTAGDHKVELEAGVAGDLNVIGAVVLRHKVVQAGHVVGSTGRAQSQHVAVVVVERERPILTVEALQRDRDTLSLVEGERVGRLCFITGDA